MKTTNLKQLVCNLCSGQYSQSEVVEFINLTQKISLSYLKYQEMMGNASVVTVRNPISNSRTWRWTVWRSCSSRDENLQFSIK